MVRVQIRQPPADIAPTRGDRAQLEARVAIDQPGAERAGVPGGAEHGRRYESRTLPDSCVVSAAAIRRRRPATSSSVSVRSARAEVQPQRQRDVAGVRSAPGRGRRRTPRRRSVAPRRRARATASTSSAGTASETITARSSRTSGKLVTSAYSGVVTVVIGDVQIELEGGDGGLEPPLGRDLGMQLADPARRRAADDDLPAAAGMQERLGIAGLGDGPVGTRIESSMPPSTPLAAKKSAARGSGSRQVAGRAGPLSSAATW